MSRFSDFINSNGKLFCVIYNALRLLLRSKSLELLIWHSTAKTRIFQAAYCLCIIAGSAMNFKSIINLSDAVTLFLAVPNLIAVFALSGVIMKELKRYCDRYKVGGRISDYLR